MNAIGSPGDRRGASSIGRGWLGVRGALLSLIAVKIAVGSLADASLPDPGWIAGIYDGGDFDDVVDQVASLVGLCDWWVPVLRREGACNRLALADTEVVARTGRIPRHDPALPVLLPSSVSRRPAGCDGMASAGNGRRSAVAVPA